MVDGQGMALVEPFAEGGDHFRARTLEADDADRGLQVDDLLDVGQIGGGRVAQQGPIALAAPACKTCLEHSTFRIPASVCVAGVGQRPGQQRRLTDRYLNFGLLIQQPGQGSETTETGAEDEDKGLGHYVGSAVERFCTGNDLLPLR